MAAMVTVLFFCSGLVALALQMVWVRALGLVVGNSLWSATMVVAAFMGGMALGSALVARFAPRIRFHLRLYAGAEILVALMALATPVLLGPMGRLAAHLGPEPLGSWGVPLLGRLLLVSLFLLLPTTAMGATVPLVVERIGHRRTVHARVGLLYAVNTAGAVAGVVVGAFVALPLLGEKGTLSAAATVALLVALGAWFLEPHLPREDPREGPPAAAGGGPWILWPALFGAVALACELVWTRILLLHLGSRVYAFALVLAVFLTGIALGAALARRWRGSPRSALAFCQVGVGLAIAVQIPLLARFSDFLSWLATHFPAGGFWQLQGLLAAAVAVLILPATLCFGASFPLVVAEAPGSGSVGARTGRVTAANTLGSIAGALAGPLLLVPLVGSQAALLLLAVVSVLAGVLLGRGPALRSLAAVAGVSLAAVAMAYPREAVLMGADSIADATVESVRESASATVAVRLIHDSRGEWRSLELNGVNVAGTSRELRAIQRLQGHLPLLLAPRPERVLHIGFGSGGTAWAVSRHQEVEEIVIAEISPDVLAVSDSVFGDVNYGVLGDPRVRIILNDGRNALLALKDSFDAVLSDSIHPVWAGNSSLYTREYFELCRARLRPGGVVSMWLPTYSLTEESFLAILRAFWEVFPGTAVWYAPVVLNEFTVVTGTVAPGPLGIRWNVLAEPGLAETLAEAGIVTAEDLAGMLLLGPREVARLVADEPAHVDDFPQVEYLSGRLLDREGSWLRNLRMLNAFRARGNPFLSFPGDWGVAAAQRDEVLKAHLRELAGRTSRP